jgi:hypothetical protein
MKKIFAIFLAWMLVLPGFAAAADNAVLPPVPATGNVTLPLDEYNRLVELASKPTRKPEAPPVPYTVKRADLKFRVANESVQGTVQLQGEILHKGATKVPLTNGMAILDARQEGKSLPLELENGTHTAVLSGPADFAVILDAGLPLSIEAGRASFSLPVPSAGSAQLALVVPGDHTYVRINPGIITSRSSAKGQTSIEATLVPGQPANIWWTTRETAAPVVPKEVRFLSDVKTLVSVSESEIQVAALADITVVQGEPSQFQIEVPAGFEVNGATGASVESSEFESGVLTLKVTGPAQRSHQFLISMEKSITATKADAPFLSFKDAQRETGEVLVEGAGTIELTATEAGGLKRMDFKEMNPYLRSLSRFPMQAAFRYHKQPNEKPTLAFTWTRFPDSSVLAAVAERAVVTTLVTTEGRSLTEIKLTIKNQAQPFLKVELPTGANILSAEVAGGKVKPVEGSDGNRVPLLRAGFRPVDAYTVSFVFMHSGAPFAKKGGSDLSLPKMDVPINLLQWEVFLPEQYKVKDFGGDAIAANLLPPSMLNTADGELRPISTGSNLQVVATETVEVAAIPMNGRNYSNLEPGINQRDARKNAEKQQMAASSNVTNLQQRISGVLPVRIDVPRAGNSYNFVRPLVLDEETKVTFTYKSK